MVLLPGINDNIIFPHPSYSGVYHDEAKKIDIYKVINTFFGSEPKKTDKMVVHIFCQYWYF